MATISTSKGKQAAETLMWIRWAEADYLGARMLLLIDLLLQGTALSNTAIEKYLKGVCCHSGSKIPHNHNVDKLYTAIKSQNAKHELDLNMDYLEVLSKAYKLRYPDELKDGFNISLNQAKLLAQLDRSVQEITKRFRIENVGKPVLMVLDEAKQKNDVRYLDRNVAVDPAKASALLFSGPSRCYDLRNHQGSIMEALYTSASVKDDLVFNAPGMVPDLKNPKSFNLAYLPIQN
jgi:HEPN domain-containing protein